MPFVVAAAALVALVLGIAVATGVPKPDPLDDLEGPQEAIGGSPPGP